MTITTQQILDAQRAWAQGIIAIGESFTAGEDYRERASQHIRQLYAYDQGGVLFKPTLAAAQPFRHSFDDALSYFVGGKHSEDNGFAIRPWVAVEYSDVQHLLTGDSALSMGHYHFTPKEDTTQSQKVEFTFGYIRDDSGALRINLHHSSLPYAG